MSVSRKKPGAGAPVGMIFQLVYAVIAVDSDSATARNRFARTANWPVGSCSPRFQRASVPWSTPIRRAASPCVIPMLSERKPNARPMSCREAGGCNQRNRWLARIPSVFLTGLGLTLGS
jgi:hypothetical protein